MTAAVPTATTPCRYGCARAATDPCSACAEGLQGEFDDLRGLDGMYVGSLSDEEQEAFARLCRAGRARRDYGGAAGFFGLGRVRLIHPADADAAADTTPA